MLLDELSYAIQESVYEYLDVYDLAHLSQANRFLRDFIKGSKNLWGRAVMTYYFSVTYQKQM